MTSVLTMRLVSLGIFPNSPQGRVAQLMICGVEPDAARFFGDSEDTLSDESFEALRWRVLGEEPSHPSY